MPRKKIQPLTFVERMQKMIAAGIVGNKPPNEVRDADGLAPLEERVKSILGLTEKIRKTQDRMLFFVMYDIESNKVRTQIAKYLERKGCTRIQKSIFLAEAPIETYNSIKSDLAEVQAAYDNEDSIIVLPITTDYLRMMKIIGQKIEIDIITHSRNTLFF